ncbi:MAG: hypothetical protein ACN2B6_09665 [Rickettsiales bacterium]
MVSLGYNITFDPHREQNGFLELDSIFVEELKRLDSGLHERLVAARTESSTASDEALMNALVPYIEAFITGLRNDSEAMEKLAKRHASLVPFYVCKWQFIQPRASNALSFEAAARVDGDALLSMLPIPGDNLEVIEFSFAKVIAGWLENEAQHKALLEIAARYAAWALYSDKGRKKHADGLLFTSPVN